LRPLIAAKAPANAGRKSAPDWGKKQIKRKRHRAFIYLGLVLLAKLSKGKVDFAHNHGTVPLSPAGVVEFERCWLLG
jgi:hypothetical protein